ncbi:hypothetical protein TI05_19595, partial [Achromatium sp. WMS3]
NALTWEQQRQAGKAVRADFTGTLKDHGVKGFGFAQCTNGIYKPLFGATASQLKDQLGLDKKASLREYREGDDIRNMDWKVTARTNKPHLKIYREERERSVMLCIDKGPHMEFGTRNTK